MSPCSACARHVRHTETACPFCGAAFAAPAPRPVARIGRVTRAAVFSAALVACGKHDEPRPAPARTGSAEKLDQDFNQLLGSAEPGSAAATVGSVADAAIASDAAGDAAQVAVPADAMSDEERTRQLQRDADRKHQLDRQRDAELERRRQLQEQQRLQQQQLQDEQLQHHYNAKPYGAPPARRRVV